MQYESVLWKPIPGYEGLYEVSVFGQIASTYRCRPGVSRLLEPRCIHGHLRVNLSKERVSRLCKVADLVLLAFVGEQPAGARARHRDGDVGNCALENLEWG